MLMRSGRVILRANHHTKREWTVHIEFCGAARVVTGSMHLLHIGGKRVLLDCGLYQGRRSEAFDINRNFCFEASSIDAVVLSHAHIDHCGNLPSLVRHGFRGKIYATSATRDLCANMLLDSARIQESDVRYVNRRRREEKKKEFKPLYTQEDAVQAIRQFKSMEYHEPFTVLPGVEVTFYDAGHMLGSAAVKLELSEEGGPPVCLVFSGDIGRYQQPVLRDPDPIAGAEYVIMEATYGDRLHENDQDTEETIRRVCESVWEERGKLIIPAFSVGRTQTIVYVLNRLAEAGKLPPFKVFVDSPLAIEATEVYQQHIECFDDDFIRDLLNEEDRDPLGFRGLFYTRKVEHSKQINTLEEPVIIVSASGMCEAGRILHHLKNNIEKSSTTVLFAGYQAPNTLGRRILDGAPHVNIFGQRYEVNCKVARLESASGHGDQSELLHWLTGLAENGRIQNVALVHCELEPATVLADRIAHEQISDVFIPKRGDTMPLVPVADSPSS